MKKVFIYQIIDALSENVLQNFIGPNDRFAESVFTRFCNSDGMKNVDLEDIVLVRCDSEHIFESYDDFEHNRDYYEDPVLYYGSEVVSNVESKEN